MTAPLSLPLGSIASFIRGITFKPTDTVPTGTAGAVDCMRTRNVQTQLDLSDVWGIPIAFVKRPEQFLQAGDVLVSSANSWNLVGKCCWVPTLPRVATFGGFTSVLRANPTRVEPRYLYHWFSAPRTQKLARSFGQQTTNIANLNLERCLSLPVPIPTLSEQRRIADSLDKADALRAKRRAALALLDALTQSIFVEMFGGLAATTTLGSVVNEFRYGTSMKSGQEGPFVLRIPNVVGGVIDLRDLKRVRLSGGELHRLRLIDGDVLFVRSNGNPSAVGRCAVYQEEAVGEGPARSAPFVFASYLIRARLNSGIVEPTFIRDFLATPDGRRQLRAAAKTSAGQFNINIDGLSNVGIPLPSLKDQRRYAARVRAVEAHRGAQVRSLAHLDALFASLQHRAFRGEL